MMIHRPKGGYCMATQKQISKWRMEAEKINRNPDYIDAYVEYREKAKKADQRLVRLEALRHEEHFHGVLSFSYKRAIRDITSWGGDKRFNIAPPTTVTQIRSKISDIDSFLSKPTSKKSSILKIYKKKAQTINERYASKYGVEFTWEDIANYYESDTAKKNDSVKGSKTLVQALAVLKGITREDLQDIEDVNERIERVSEDNTVNHVARQLLKQGYTYENLMK